MELCPDAVIRLNWTSSQLKSILCILNVVHVPQSHEAGCSNEILSRPRLIASWQPCVPPRCANKSHLRRVDRRTKCVRLPDTAEEPESTRLLFQGSAPHLSKDVVQQNNPSWVSISNVDLSKAPSHSWIMIPGHSVNPIQEAQTSAQTGSRLVLQLSARPSEHSHWGIRLRNRLTTTSKALVRERLQSFPP